jgi:purine-binding chemotaxis protein CheW
MKALFVMFRVGNADYVMPASSVLELESFTGATQVPGAPPYLRGLLNVRGRVVPAIDLRARFGLPPIEPSIDTRIVVGRVEGRIVGLVVDSAREVVALGSDAFHPPPDVIAEQTQGFVQSIAESGQRLLMLLDFSKVIGEESTHAQ